MLLVRMKLVCQSSENNSSYINITLELEGLLQGDLLDDLLISTFSLGKLACTILPVPFESKVFTIP